MRVPCLYIVVPCYNEETVLSVTSCILIEKLVSLIEGGKIDSGSRVLFVDDGSEDATWKIICDLSQRDVHCIGISLSRNRGHQNAVLAGLMTAKEYCDITISIDCDGQDDINAIDQMIDAYGKGYEIVYGVRSSRVNDTFFKRITAEGFYKLLYWLGAEVVYNHADYRLISSKVLEALADFKEVNIYLRGMIPLVGFKSTNVYYERKERIAGKSHYPLRKMLALALNGITSLSVKPIRLIALFGLFVTVLSFVGITWAIIGSIMGSTIPGWTSIICIVCFLEGFQLLSVGIIGEYIGKIYLETKRRPRYIISAWTNQLDNIVKPKEEH